MTLDVLLEVELRGLRCCVLEEQRDRAGAFVRLVEVHAAWPAVAGPVCRGVLPHFVGGKHAAVRQTDRKGGVDVVDRPVEGERERSVFWRPHCRPLSGQFGREH